MFSFVSVWSCIDIEPRTVAYMQERYSVPVGTVNADGQVLTVERWAETWNWLGVASLHATEIPLKVRSWAQLLVVPSVTSSNLLLYLMRRHTPKLLARGIVAL
jgi:hypothetical protein